jgi:hypothetical protein
MRKLRYLVLSLVLLTASPHGASQREAKRDWVLGMVRSCYAQKWRDTDPDKDYMCRVSAEALADLYMKEHKEALR